MRFNHLFGISQPLSLGPISLQHRQWSNTGSHLAAVSNCSLFHSVRKHSCLLISGCTWSIATVFFFLTTWICSYWPTNAVLLAKYATPKTQSKESVHIKSNAAMRKSQWLVLAYLPPPEMKPIEKEQIRKTWHAVSLCSLLININ